MTPSERKREYRRALADHLLAATEASLGLDLPSALAGCGHEVHANIAANALRAVVGAAVRACGSDDHARAMQAQLAPALGDMLGTLLKDQDTRIQAAALEGHAALLAQSLGRTPAVTVSVSPPPHRGSHLKVVQ